MYLKLEVVSLKMSATCLALLFIFLVTQEVTSQRCSTLSWTSDLGESPLANHGGKVVLVALMKGYCSYCVNQASKLEILKNRLIDEGYIDIAMVIVNGGEHRSRVNIGNLQQASSIPVIQDTEQEVMYREIFRRNKDDFIVFDRCSQRAMIIPHPYSYLGFSVTERVLKTVYAGNHACACHLNPVSQMQADEPQDSKVIASKELNLQCHEGDQKCLEFEEKYNTNQLEDGGQKEEMAHKKRRKGKTSKCKKAKCNNKKRDRKQRRKNHKQRVNKKESQTHSLDTPVGSA